MCLTGSWRGVREASPCREKCGRQCRNRTENNAAPATQRALKGSLAQPVSAVDLSGIIAKR